MVLVSATIQHNAVSHKPKTTGHVVSNQKGKKFIM